MKPTAQFEISLICFPRPPAVAYLFLVRPHARRTHCSIAGIGCFRLLRPPTVRAAVTCCRRYSYLWPRGERRRANAPGGDCSRSTFVYQAATQDLFDRRCESRGDSCLPYAAQPTVGRIPNIQAHRWRMARPRSRGRRFDSISVRSNQSMKPTAPLRNKFSFSATASSPWFISFSLGVARAS